VSAPVIDIRGVWNRLGERDIHRGIDLCIERGETLALTGGSGSGKTTLLRTIIGLQEPSRGELLLFGESLAQARGARRQRLLRRMGMLFQQGALFSALPVFDNIAFPLRELRELDEAMIAELVMLKLAQVGLEARDAGLMPAELSGGMVKRVALARALALEPELLILDEPTAGLDPDRSAAFVELITMLQHELDLTVVMVTHDLDTLAAMAASIAFLDGGAIVYRGPLADALASTHPHLASFIAPLAARAAPGGG
jgi:phospholipid/cholesterol/gamma-HCH transport system ATP-binding protein